MYQDFNENYSPRKRRTLEKPALTLGIISIIFSSIFYVALPCGALAVIFAALSRSRGPLKGKLKTALFCGLAGIIASICITGYTFYQVCTNPEMLHSVEAVMRQYTGDYSIDLEAELKALIPFYHGLESAQEVPDLQSVPDSTEKATGQSETTDSSEKDRQSETSEQSEPIEQSEPAAQTEIPDQTVPYDYLTSPEKGVWA